VDLRGEIRVKIRVAKGDLRVGLRGDLRVNLRVGLRVRVWKGNARRNALRRKRRAIIIKVL
jgi:hypothetical protein